MNPTDKIALLQSTALFQQVPENLLEQIASSIKEKTIGKGEIIIQKGETGHAMFIIVKGSVRVHNENNLIKELSDGEIFGELAALAISRRVASVSALTDVQVLRIESAALYDVMSADIGLAKAIIKALCERMESMSLKSQEEKKRMTPPEN